MKRLLRLLVLLPALAFAQQAPDYTNYKPTFQTDVYVVNPFVANPATGIMKQELVNPAYALSETSALELTVVLKDYGVTLFHSGPFGWLTSGQFTVTRTVPWLQFPNGAVVNAGLIAWYFSHGFPAPLVQAWVKSDLDSYVKWWPDNAYLFSWVVKQP